MLKPLHEARRTATASWGCPKHTSEANHAVLKVTCLEARELGCVCGISFKQAEIQERQR